jgi:hypothetical protein
MPKTITVLLSFVLTLSLAFASNHGDLEIERGEQAMLRIAHLSPDAFDVDVRFGDETILEDLAYEDISAYKIIPSGTHTITLHEAGEDSAAIEATIDFEAGAYYTLAALGFAEDLQAFLFVDNFRDSYPAANEALVRVIHASPDADNVDVYRLYDGDSESLATGLAFSQVSEYMTIDAYTYDFELRVAGDNDVLVELEDLELKPGHVYTLFVIGSREGEANGDTPVVEAEEEATAVAEGEEEDERDVDDTELRVKIAVDARVDGEPLDNDFEQERN